MDNSYVAEVNELSEPEFTHHVDSAGIIDIKQQQQQPENPLWFRPCPVQV